MRGKHSLFYKHMLTYMVVAMVTVLVFGVVLYRHNLTFARENLDNEHSSALSESRVFLDSQLASLYDLSVVLQERQETVAIQHLDQPVSPDAISMLNSYSRELQPYSYASRYLEEIILYFHGSELFLSSSTVGLYPEAFYDVIMSYGGVGYEEWRRTVAPLQDFSVFYGVDSRNGRAFVDILRDLPYYLRKNKATLIARFDVANLTEGLDYYVQNGAAVLIRTYDGRPVYTTSDRFRDFAPPAPGAESVTVHGETYRFFTQRLQNVSWDYILLVPEHRYTEQNRNILITMLVLCLVILAAGGILSLLFSLYTMAPLRALLRFVGRPGSKLIADANEFETLTDSINSLIRNNRSLQDTVEKQREQARWSFLETLFKGQFLSAEERDAMARYSNVRLTCSGYLLILLELTGYNQELHEAFLREIDLASTVAVDTIASMVDQGVLIHKCGFGEIAMLYCLDRESREPEARQQVLLLRKELEKRTGFRLRCVASRLIGDVDRISSVYFALQEHLAKTDAPGDSPADEGLMEPPAESVSMGSYYYPTEFESRILGNIVAGNAKEAKDNLRWLFEENMEKYNVSVPRIIYFTHAIKCTMIRARNDIELEEASGERFDFLIYLSKEHELPSFLLQCQELIELLCAAVNERKQRKASRLVDSINAFIEERYSDSGLGLSMVAGQFRLADNYLSYFYKSQTGENLSAMIEGIRMGKAGELLLAGGLSVKDVAEQVGYPNLNTFYKAFKRRYGISPKGYSERRQ